MIARGILRIAVGAAGFFFWIAGASAKQDRAFSFGRDTFAFANETILEYHQGRASARHDDPFHKPKRFTQHCFVMSRSVIQFRKFARFEPALPRLDERELAARVRKVTSQTPWTPAAPPPERIVIPGYRDLRSLSDAHPDILQENIGLGWTTYFRPGNWRVLLPHGATQQARTEAALERALVRGEYFVAYLTNIPKSLNINHGVLVYARQERPEGETNSGKLRYSVYDPNHPDGPRTLEWSRGQSCFLYQRDTDFVGGPVVVWQVYGGFLQ